ncbi:hypothetical protein [Thermomicrobium sp.]
MDPIGELWQALTPQQRRRAADEIERLLREPLTPVFRICHADLARAWLRHDDRAVRALLSVLAVDAEAGAAGLSYDDRYRAVAAAARRVAAELRACGWTRTANQLDACAEQLEAEAADD